jgi:hypothetical protein
MAIRSPGLKRKLAKEVIKSGVTAIKPTVKKATQQMGSLLSPFATNLSSEQPLDETAN